MTSSSGSVPGEPSGAHNVVNYVLYQAGWLACVPAAGSGRPGVGMSVALALLGAHVLLATRRAAEVARAAAFGAIGGLLDSALTAAGVLAFPSGSVVEWACPPWIVVMWMQFASLFRFCLAWTSGRYALAMGLGAAGGPLAYWAGARLGAVSFPGGATESLPWLAAAWATVLPVLLRLSDALDLHGGPGRYRFPGKFS